MNDGVYKVISQMQQFSRESGCWRGVVLHMGGRDGGASRAFLVTDTQLFSFLHSDSLPFPLCVGVGSLSLGSQPICAIAFSCPPCDPFPPIDMWPHICWLQIG